MGNEFLNMMMGLCGKEKNNLSAEEFYKRGNAKYNKGDKEGAIADYKMAIELKSDYAAAFNNMGNAKDDMGDYEEAILDYTMAIELRADYALAFNNRGYAKHNKGDYEGAIADYKMAIKLKPDYATAFKNMGNARYDMGDKEGAIADYTKAIELKPDYAVAFNKRGIVKDDKGDYEEAIEDYKMAIELKGDYAEAFNNMGIAKDNMGDTEGAIADYTKAIELEPDYALAFNNRGNANHNKGDYKGAIADYTKAIKLRPNCAESFNNRGIARYNKGDYKGAIADYKMAIKLKPDYAAAFNNRGYANHNKGNYKEAIADYTKAVELDPQKYGYRIEEINRLKSLIAPKPLSIQQGTASHVYTIIELDRLRDLTAHGVLSIEDLESILRHIHTNDDYFKTVIDDLEPNKIEKLSLIDLQDRLKLLMEYYGSFSTGTTKDNKFKKAYNNLLDAAVARGGKDALVFSKLEDIDIDNTLLHLAARHCNVNDTEFLEKILKINQELINYPNPGYFNYTPLHVVTLDTIKVPIAKFLLENGADPDMKAQNGYLFEEWFKKQERPEYYDLMKIYKKIRGDYFIKAAADNKPDLIVKALNSIDMRGMTIKDLTDEEKETIKEAFLLAHDVGSRDAIDKILDVIGKESIFQVLRDVNDGICNYDNKLYDSAKESLEDAISKETSEKIKKQIGMILGKVKMEHAMVLYNKGERHHLQEAFKLMTSGLDNNSGLLEKYRDEISKIYLAIGNEMAVLNTGKVDPVFYYVNAHRSNPKNDQVARMIDVHGQFHTELASILSNEILASQCVGSNRVPCSTPNKTSRFLNLAANTDASVFSVPLKLVLGVGETLEDMEFSRVGKHFIQSVERDNFITKVSSMASQHYMAKINEINSSNSTTKTQEIKGLASYVATHVIKYLSTDVFEKNSNAQTLLKATVQHVLSQPEMDRGFYTKMSDVISKRMSKMISNAENVSIETPEGKKRIIRDQCYTRASSGGSSSMQMHM